MLEQYYIQYDLNGCCLRAPWIMEKDDFKYQLSFGEDVFGGPRWRDSGRRRAGRRVHPNADGPGHARSGGRAGEAKLRPRRGSGRTRSCWRSTIPRRASRRSTSAWTSRSTTANWASTSPRRAAAARSRSHAVSLDLARQRQSEVPARLAAALRPDAPDRRGLRLPARRRRPARSSGIRVEHNYITKAYSSREPT